MYDRLGYSQDMITQLGCSPPLGASGPGGGAAKESDPKAKILAGAAPEGPPDHRGHCHGKKYINKHFPTGTKHVFWASVECGLVLPSISAWEVVGKEKPKTTGGYMCRFCKGFWKASRGGTRLLQITGWHKDKATCLQLAMDEPPEQLYNQWIRDRMEFYKRVEPTELSRDERLVLGDASTPRMRFSSSNGLGDVSTALWSVILSNPEKSGLAAIHSVAKEAILKGESRQVVSHYPFGGGVVYSLPTGTWVPLAPSWVGGGVGVFPFFGVLCSFWSPPCFNTPRLPVASNRRLHNLAAPRTGRIGHCLKKVAAAEPGFPEVL